MTDPAGRTAFITGGANGIGLGIARSFARAGVKLALVDLDAAALAQAKGELANLTKVEVAVLNVRDRDAFARVADEFEATLGPVSLLVNNAGVAGGAPAARMTYALWDWGLGINLHGVISGVQTFLPRMAARGGGGHIVNTASGAGLAASGSALLYHTAKFGVVGLSEAMAIELKPAGIGVTVLCPGPVATEIVARTRELQPVSATTLTREELARSERASKWLARGMSPDTVGDLVLSAVRQDQLYVHTDRVMADAIAARCQAMLAAMPDTVAAQ